MIRITTIYLLILFAIACTAQEVKLPIIISKNWFKQDVYKHNNKRIYMHGIKKLVKTNDSALCEFKKVTKITCATIAVSLLSGAVFGLFINGLVNGNAANAIPIALAGGLYCTTFPLQKQSKLHLTNTIQIYNRSILTPSK